MAWMFFLHIKDIFNFGIFKPGEILEAGKIFYLVNKQPNAKRGNILNFNGRSVLARLCGFHPGVPPPNFEFLKVVFSKALEK